MSGTTAVAVSAALLVGIAGIYVVTKSKQVPHIVASSPDAHTVLMHISRNLARIDPRYGEVPLREGQRSETINKSVIHLCLKDPRTNKYYDMNTLMYVTLHELSHVLSNGYVTDSKGHADDPEFNRIFTALKQKATSLGIYNPKIPLPPVYCGVRNYEVR